MLYISALSEKGSDFVDVNREVSIYDTEQCTILKYVILYDTRGISLWDRAHYESATRRVRCLLRGNGRTNMYYHTVERNC